MTESYSDIQKNVRHVVGKLTEAALSVGRDPASIRLMAVTKSNSIDRINCAIAAGITLLGENRAQDLLDRYGDYTKEGCDIHFIGHLQRNKVRSVIDKVSMIESVDRLSLAAEIDRCAAASGRIMPVLVEVNIGGEANKSGVAPEGLEQLLTDVARFSHLCVLGLMSIPPNVDDNRIKEGYFSQMHRLFLDIKAKKLDNVNMDILSMGMSYDYPLAIRHGSTIVRVGRAIFGTRL